MFSGYNFCTHCELFQGCGITTNEDNRIRISIFHSLKLITAKPKKIRSQILR